MSFPYSEFLIPGRGKWGLLEPVFPNPRYSISLWHETQPLQRLNNDTTSRIVDMAENELYKWFDPHSMKPMAVSQTYQLVR